MNRRHFIKVIALFATIPLLPPGKEWAEETGWIPLKANQETIIMFNGYGPPEVWTPREENGYNVYVLDQDNGDGTWSRSVSASSKPDRIEHHNPLEITGDEIPMTPPRKE